MLRVLLGASFVLAITAQSHAALVQRLDASNLPTGALATWNDTSLNSNDVSQATAANQPTVVNGGSEFNDLNVVRFQQSGANSDELGGAASFTGKEVLIVFREDAQSTTRLGQLWGDYSVAHVAIDGRSGGGGFSFDGNVGTLAQYSLDGSPFVGPVDNSANGVWSQNTTHLVDVLYSGSPAFSNTFLGSLEDSTFTLSDHNLDADIGEILVFDTALTSDERIGLQYLMARRWGLSGFTRANQSQIDAANALIPGGYLVAPEPSTALMLLGGMFGLSLIRRRRS